MGLGALALLFTLFGAGLACAHEVEEGTDAGQAAKPEPVYDLLPRRPIDGLHGIETHSVLRYVAAPDEPRAFEAVYVFPDRARWEFELATGDSRRVYRAGRDVFYSQSGPSQPLEDAQRDMLVGEIELRRALLVWPHGFEWKELESGEREADLGIFGRLRATVDAETGLPTRLALHTPDGRKRESYRALEWRKDKGRRWPAALEFWHGDSHLWDETIERASPARYVDSFFTPADRRGTDVEDGEAAQGVQPLQAFTGYRVELPKKTSWDDALKRADEERARWAAKLPDAKIAERPTLALGADGRPSAIWIRIEPPLRPAPDGWTQLPERQGVASFAAFEVLAELNADRVSWMRERVPRGAEPGEAYVRVDREAGQVQLVQPFER